MTLCLLPMPTEAEDTPPTLTAREAQIAGLIADGHSLDVIARRLGRSYHTVRSHVRAIAAKLPGRADDVRRIRAWALAQRDAAA